MTKRIMFMAAAAIALTTSTIARADAVGAGTVSSAHLFNPTVTTTTNPGSYSISNGGTFQVSATNAFAGSSGGLGTMNGTLLFSENRGTTITENDPGFFSFSDGKGGNFVFDVTSVFTNSFVMNSSLTSGSLYLLGSVYDSFLNLTASAASLTITFNSTGGSAFSSSATLSSPPVSVTPEPSSLVLLGTGLVGAATTLVRRRRAARA